MSILFLSTSGCQGAEDPGPLQPPEPKTVGRYQIVSVPAGMILKIDTHNGETDRLVQDPENGAYSWEFVP